MKRIIEKKVYNTKAATKIAEWTNGLPASDFKAIEEVLYVTKKGIFFLKYWGGAATRYCKYSGNFSTEGAGIIVLSNNEAYSWLEKHEYVNEIEKYFSDELESA